MCMENDIGCKLIFSRQKISVYYIPKHLDKSVLMHLFKFPFTNTKIVNQYHITYTLYSDLNHVNYLNIIKIDHSEWMVVRPFRSLVQLRGSPNASGLQAHDLFL